MKILANICRILCGLTFIFSAFVKGVDPLGFTYRIEDYFIAFNMQWAIPLSLTLSILMCTLEFSVGVMLLLKLRMKLTSWLLLLMMVFFTLLTLNDAIFTIVPDCGCFGDAVKLTNWQTFYKNLVLIAFAIVIFSYRKKFKEYWGMGTQWLIADIFAILFVCFCVYNYRHLPIIDFTEWKTGAKLYTENPKPIQSFLTYKDKKTGKQEEFLSSQMPYNDSIWMENHEFVSQRVVDSNFYAGKLLHIYDTTGNDVSQSIKLNPDYQLIINSYSFELANPKAFQNINEFAGKAYDNDVQTAVLVAADNPTIRNYALQHQLDKLEFYNADDIILKTMVRSNPGMMLLKNGEIIKKWHWRDIPDFETFKAKYLK